MHVCSVGLSRVEIAYSSATQHVGEHLHNTEMDLLLCLNITSGREIFFPNKRGYVGMGVVGSRPASYILAATNRTWDVTL